MTDKIIKIISEVLETPVDVSASQTTCENWDSMHHLNIIFLLEETFGIYFEPEQIVEMKSVEAIENVIKRYQK